MDHHTSYRATAVDGRRSSRLRFVLLGALAPVALFALPVGTMMFVGPSGEAASVAGSGPALDCESPRNAWRPACQTARSNLAGNLARDADVTGSISDGPAATAALDQKGKRRSVAGAIASAAKSTAEAAAQAASPAQK